MNLPIEAMLFDWGDTLVHFPGITTDERTHLACLQELFEEAVGRAQAGVFRAHWAGLGAVPADLSSDGRSAVDGEQGDAARASAAGSLFDGAAGGRV